MLQATVWEKPTPNAAKIIQLVKAGITDIPGLGILGYSIEDENRRSSFKCRNFKIIPDLNA